MPEVYPEQAGETFQNSRRNILQNADFKETWRELSQLQKSIDELWNAIEVDKLREKLAELESDTQKNEVWSNKEKFSEINQEISRIKRKIDPWIKLKNETAESIDLLEMAEAEADASVINEVAASVKRLTSGFDELETRELLSENDDIRDAFISIHPGAGGTESQDWASMLLRMYSRWAEKNGYTVEIIDYTQGEEAGIKSATILVKGEYAYGLLKGETGVHRLVRISPFDANKRRHTSFSSVEIMPDIEEDVPMEINENDLRIDTYRASGAGGQHINKTDSAVRITHLPTGIVVQCQNERSQHKNKAFAMKVLKARLYELYKQEQNDKKMVLAGEKKEISWGNQLRSYVFQPYTLVKDHRTGEETGSVDYVFDGELNRFLYAYLKSIKHS